MDVKYLTYIVTIAKSRSITQAAKELYVSQSSLSQYLARLEQELGTPLFLRSKNQLTLTPAGRLYVESAQQVIQIQQTLYGAIRELSCSGHLTVGVTSQFGLDILTQAIPRFQSQYPKMSIEISQLTLPDIQKQLLEDQLDLAILADLQPSLFPGQRRRLLWEEEVWFAVPRSHPFVRFHPETEGPLTAQTLAEHFSQNPVLLAKKGSSLRLLSDRFFEGCRFSPSVFCETNSISAARSMIAEGAAVAFLGESCALDKAHIAYYSLSPRLCRSHTAIFGRSWKETPAAQCFQKLLFHFAVRPLPWPGPQEP